MTQNGIEGCFPHGCRAALSLTFDDARLSQADRGLAILDEHDVKATFYISFHAAEQRLEAWRRALAGGHELGNHTVNHPCTANFAWARRHALEDYTLARMEQELLGANERIEKLFGVKPTTFAYPCGQTYVGRGQALQSYIPLVGRYFVAGRSFKNEAWNSPQVCDLAQTFAFDCDGMDLARFEELMEATEKEGAWLVLAGHEIADAGRQTTHCSFLDAVCRWARRNANRVWTDTVANVAAHIASRQRR